MTAPRDTRPVDRADGRSIGWLPRRSTMQWEQPAFLEIRMDAELTYVNDLERDAAEPETATAARPVEAVPAA